MKFEQSFDTFACEGDSIQLSHGGLTFTARIERDEDSNIDDDDVHNPNQDVTGCDAEQQTKLLEARRAWLADEWFYCGITIEVSLDGNTILDGAASLWGIECNYPESDNSYLNQIANELLVEAVECAKAKIESLQIALNQISL